MASYDALINLRVKGLDQLSKVEKAVNNINGKGTSGSKSGSKRRLTEEEKIVKEKIKGLVAENRAIRTQTQQIGLKKKGIRFDETSKQLQEAISKAKGGQLDEANLLIQKATKAINLGKKELALENKTTKAVVNTNRAKSRGNRITKAAIRSGISSSVFGSAAQPGSPKFIASRAGMVQGPALPPVIQGPTSPIGGTRSMFGSPAQRAFSGGPRSPIRGTKSMAGSPAALAALAGGKGSGALQSALISAAFPLLFGQGPLGGAAGFAGGFLGTKMGGQMGGFAGGLVATAALQSIQQTIGAVSQLGQALNPLTADMSALTKAAGLMGTVDANRLALIQEVQGKQAALNAALREMTSVVGEKGVKALQKFGEQTTALTNAWSKFMTSVFASIAEALNKSGLTDKLTNLLNNLSGADSGLAFAGSSNASAALQGRAGQLNSLNTQIAGMQSNLGAGGGIKAGDEKRAAIARLGEEEYNTELKKLDALVQQKRVLEEIIAEKANIEQIEHNALETQKIINEAAFGAMEKENLVAKDTMQVGAARAELNEKIREAQDEYLKILQKVDPTIKQISAEEAKRVKDAVELNDELTRTAALSEQLRTTFTDGLASGIEGLITGTKTLKESLAGILRDFGSILLRTGLKNAMPGFGSFFGLGSAEGNYLANGIRPFASGGMVTRPTMGLVGEAGEDEYVIPASKMASSMQRYSAGARGQAVIPGTGASLSGGASGSSTTVNYSGPILNFNSEEFVPKSAVGQIINSAASKGAAAGESRTMSTLRNSRSARSRIGM